MSLWADDQWWKEMHAPRHPAPPVSEGDALAKAFADYESTREDVARRTDPMRANSLLLAGAGLANAVKDHLVQLQVQAPVGEGLENSVSDGEREAYRFWRNHWGADVPPVDDAFQAGWDAAHLAAGYRKAPVVHRPRVTWTNAGEPPREGRTCTCGLAWPHVLTTDARTIADALHADDCADDECDGSDMAHYDRQANIVLGLTQAPVVNVEDVADLIEPLVPVPATSPDGIWGHGQRLVAEQIATAIKAHLLDGGDRG